MLMLPTPNMSVTQHNLAATPATTGAFGTTITANSSANTKATSWTTLITSTNFDVSMMMVAIANNSIPGAVRNSLIDIGVGASSSEQTLISNLMGTFTTNLTTGSAPTQYYCPVYIPKGARVSARSQCSTGSQTASVLIYLYGGASSPPWRVFARAEGIGVDTSTSKGTAITAGNTGSESSWTSVGSATAREYRAIQPMIGTDVSGTMASLAYHLEWGYSSTTLGERYFIGNNTEFVGNLLPSLPDIVTVPSGTQMQIRAECSGTAESLQYGLLGFY